MKRLFGWHNQKGVSNQSLSFQTEYHFLIEYPSAQLLGLGLGLDAMPSVGRKDR